MAMQVLQPCFHRVDLRCLSLVNLSCYLHVVPNQAQQRWQDLQKNVRQIQQERLEREQRTQQQWCLERLVPAVPHFPATRRGQLLLGKFIRDWKERMNLYVDDPQMTRWFKDRWKQYVQPQLGGFKPWPRQHPRFVQKTSLLSKYDGSKPNPQQWKGKSKSSVCYHPPNGFSLPNFHHSKTTYAKKNNGGHALLARAAGH